MLVPAMIFYQIALKSTIKSGMRNLELIFDDIFQIAKTIINEIFNIQIR